MTRTSLPAFVLCAALAPSVAYADGAVLQRANAAHLNSRAGVHAASAEASRAHARGAFEGRDAKTTAVYADAVTYQGSGLKPHTIADGRAVTVPGPQMPASEDGKRKKKIPDWASYAAGAALGGLQGALSYGLAGALGGAALGLGVSYLYSKGRYGAALGASAGSIVGGAIGGPLGAIAGALVGGLLGHFVGKLFN
jgi:hypothetical protein